MPTRHWQQELNDAEQRQQSEPTTVTRSAKCYACGNAATKWVRSTSAHFSAPRCSSCGDSLVAMFKARGVRDVTVDRIGAAQ